MEIKIDTIPPSYNKYAGRRNCWEYREDKNVWLEGIMYKTKDIVPEEPYDNATIHIHYNFNDNRPRDPDNFAGKFILDGLVKAKIIKDDNFKVIDLKLSASFGTKQKSTIITITPREEKE